MTLSPLTRARTLAIGVALAAVSALAPAGIASAATPSHLSLLSLGDSTTRAFAACGSFTDCPDFSWSTGGAPAVNSFAQRLQKSRPGTTVTTDNFAQSGNTVAQVPARIRAAVAAGVHPDVITLLIGGNDLCSPRNVVASDGYTMTPVSTFRSGVEAAISTIRSTWPSAQIELSSVPDNASQWRSERFAGARLWSSGGLCRATRGVSTSGAPLSPSAATASVAAAKKRVQDFNAALERTCSAAGPLCHWDGGALTRLDFTPDLISTVDHFHPNIAGQAAIAEVEWRASSFSHSSN